VRLALEPHERPSVVLEGKGEAGHGFGLGWRGAFDKLGLSGHGVSELSTPAPAEPVEARAQH
jgi:hypothetical protein